MARALFTQPVLLANALTHVAAIFKRKLVAVGTRYFYATSKIHIFFQVTKSFLSRESIHRDTHIFNNFLGDIDSQAFQSPFISLFGSSSQRLTKLISTANDICFGIFRSPDIILQKAIFRHNCVTTRNKKMFEINVISFDESYPNG